MAVSYFFGLPGAGKTTLLCKTALDFVKKGSYQNYYSNVHTSVPCVTYIDNEVIGNYLLENCCLFIDEALLFANPRAHAKFSHALTQFFMEHRHFHCDVFMFSQIAKGVDLQIRSITDRVYYMYKPFLIGKWITTYYQIPYKIIIPDPKKSASEAVGDIIQGYTQAPFFCRLFAHRFYRPIYYKYFDSWETYYLPPLPPKYKPNPAPTFEDLHPYRFHFYKFFVGINKRAILLHSVKDRFTAFKKKITSPFIKKDTGLS